MGPEAFVQDGVKLPISGHHFFASVFVELANGDGTAICGATLVHKRWAVSAAHCIDDGAGGYSTDVTLYFHHAHSGLIRAPVPWVRAKSFVVDTNYNGYPLYENDVLMIYLEKEIDVGPPAQIAWSGWDDLGRGAMVRAMGYGVTEKGSLASTLRGVSLPKIPRDECVGVGSQNLWPSENVGPDLCAGYRVNTCLNNRCPDVCKGDSGGPLYVWPRDVPASHAPLWERSAEGSSPVLLYGAVSRGEFPCGRGRRPSIFTSLAAHGQLVRCAIGLEETREGWWPDVECPAIQDAGSVIVRVDTGSGRGGADVGGVVGDFSVIGVLGALVLALCGLAMFLRRSKR